MEMTKDVKIGDKNFQVGRMTARDGSWVAAQLSTYLLPLMLSGKMRDALEAEGLDLASIPLPEGRKEMSESDFQNLQGHCLRVVAEYNPSGVPVPIIAQNGLWTDKELEYDIPAVATLTVHALVFNVKSFFSEGVLKSIMASFKDMKLFDTSTSTPTASGQ